jgi:hypothetical protein
MPKNTADENWTCAYCLGDSLNGCTCTYCENWACRWCYYMPHPHRKCWDQRCSCCGGSRILAEAA